MTGAMYAAIGGLKSHMSKLNVIGNNLANVNTYGYKAQRMTFRESIYGTNKAGSNGSDIMGGNNPSQIGYGCTVGSIDLNMAPSTYSPTGYGLDCMLTGEGFFMVGDKVSYLIEEVTRTNADGTPVEGAKPDRSITGTGITKAADLTKPDLTRVGDFWVDADGYICNRDNKVLYGFARVQNPYYIPNPTQAQLDEAKENGINIESETIISTELVPLRVPLSAGVPTYDNGGIIKAGSKYGNPPEVLKEDLYVWQEGDPVYPYINSQGQNRYANWDDNDYDNTKNQNRADLYGYANADAADPSLNGVKGAQVKNADGTGTEESKLIPEGTYTSQIPVARNDGENSVSSELPVQMKSMQIGTDGSIMGTVNGKTVVIGYIAFATADSPDGVTNIGGHYYKAQGGAGNLRCNTLVEMPTNYLGNQTLESNPSASDRILLDAGNSIQNGGLEASSTDVATEFAEMITAQRGYQVNTRIISVTDQMLEELANMKR